MKSHKLNKTIIFMFSLALGVQLMAIEEAKYNVVVKDGAFEIRQYESYILAETQIEGNMEDASSQAFRPLFSYISGANTRKAKVAMTSPVSQEPASEEIKMTTPVSQERVDDAWAISFMMPAEYTMETIPTPEDSRVTLREVPSRRMAVIRYSGFWDEAGFVKNRNKLEAWMDQQGVIAAGPAIWARFNAPYTPWFMRRNEVQIPLQ
jgi:hypothetical protein